jgi:hypothetical protein
MFAKALTVAAALAAGAMTPQPPATPQIPQTGPQTDQSGKGAVLCSWHVYSAALQLAERCHPGRDPELQRALGDGVGDIEAFIVRHSRPQVTAGQVAALRERGFRETADWITRNGGDFCRDPNLAPLYGELRRRGAEGVRADVADLLSVPRQPLMDPCF